MNVWFQTKFNPNKSSVKQNVWSVFGKAYLLQPESLASAYNWYDYISCFNIVT